jgi:hypothetical protein
MLLVGGDRGMGFIAVATDLLPRKAGIFSRSGFWIARVIDKTRSKTINRAVASL